MHQLNQHDIGIVLGMGYSPYRRKTDSARRIMFTASPLISIVKVVTSKPLIGIVPTPASGVPDNSILSVAFKTRS